MDKLGQEPAFPAFEHNESGYGDQITLYIDGQRQWIPFTKGINKRFYAACAAMQGILSGNHTNLQCDRTGDSAYPINQITKYNFQKIAKKSFEIADELLKQEND